MMQSKLIENLRTKDDVIKLSEELGLLKESLFKKGNEGFDTVLKSRMRKSTAEIILSEVADNDVNTYLNDTLRQVEKINAVSITLAYEPTQQNIEHFYEVVQVAIAKKIVLDLLYDPQIVGGMVISYGGRYKDYSFRKIFEDDLEATRSEILDFLSSRKTK